MSCVCTSREFYTYACISEIQLLPAQEQGVRGRQHLVCDSPCGWPSHCPAHVYLCVSLGYGLKFTSGSACKQESGNCVPQPGQRSWVPEEMGSSGCQES